MNDVVGRGTIELVGDARKLKASIDDAKKSIRTLGEGQKDISKGASASIDKYIGSLQAQNAMVGKSRRETELYKLALRGASNEQLRTADAALKLSAATERNERIFSSLKTGLIAVAALGVTAAAGLTALVVQSINTLDRLNDLNKTTGISVENLSGLSFAAKQSGGDLEGIAGSISKLSQNIGKDAEKFRALGITAKDPLEAFKQLADIFVAVEDPQLRAALGAAALGKSWQSAAPLLAEGGKRIGEMIETGQRLSGVTADMARQADNFNDSLEELKTAASGFGFKLAGDMLKPLTDIIKAIKEAYVESGKLAALWTGLGAVGAFLFTDEFASSRAKLATLNHELKVLEGNLARFDGSQFGPDHGWIGRFLLGDKGKVEAEIAAKKAQIADLVRSLEAPAAKVETPAEREARLARARRASAAAQAFVGPPDGRTDADAQARAQLALDIDRIRKGSEATLGIYANAERIMEARRAAALLDEREYYAAKLGFIALNRQAQETALQEEISRLQREKFTGKDAEKNRLDNARAITDAEAKLAKVRADSTASAVISGIQEEAANQKVAQSYVDAAAAADAYIESLRRRNRLEIEGIGRGAKFREEQAGRNEIEDKFIDQSRSLERDRRNGLITQQTFDIYLKTARDTYEAEVELYEARSEAIERAEADWSNGMNEAMQNYLAEARNVSRQTEALFTNAFSKGEDALVEFVKTGKLSFSSLADSIITDLIRIQVRQSITAPITEGINSIGGGRGIVNLLGSIFGNAGASADSAQFGIPVYPQAKGGDYMVTRPTLFLAGEAGPERATFGGAGNLGGDTIINVIDQRTASGSEPVQISERRGDGGKRQIEVLIRDAVRNGLNNGDFDKAMRNNFGASRPTVTRG